MIAAQPQIDISELRPMAFPRAVLTCAPECFDVIDVKNPFMVGQQGKVDCALAKRQWSEMMRVFQQIGIEVKTLTPVEGCEDMVFCANPIFTGLDGDGRPVCVPGHMRFPSRQREVGSHVEWCRANGYRVVDLRSSDLFEGCGDALWHPGRRLIWGGYGPRTSQRVYYELADIFDAPVLPLELRTELFYHLDTCFCPIDEKTVLVYPPALTAPGMDLLRDVFERVIEVDAYEARDSMACNAAPFLGRHVVIQTGAVKVNRALLDLGFEVIEVETSEFMKSGGSVFCMKMHLF
ncbi:MAG: hypothetical protein LAQ69_13230 [Acidobacteriia bacterium]|nr:hypothetical protein [Terriglobia bacterium]